MRKIEIGVLCILLGLGFLLLTASPGKNQKNEKEIALEKHMNVQVKKNGDTTWLWKGKVVSISNKKVPSVDATGDGLGDFEVDNLKGTIQLGDSLHGKKYYDCSCGQSVYEVIP